MMLFLWFVTSLVPLRDQTGALFIACLLGNFIWTLLLFFLDILSYFIFNLIFKDQVGFIYKIYCFNGRYLVRSIRDLRTGACYTP